MNIEQEKRNRLYQFLGELPPKKRPISSRLIEKKENDKFLLEKLSLDLNGLEEVPAYFILPKNAKSKIPGILYNHSHGRKYQVGKDELLHSAPYMHQTPYADDLTGKGYAVLAIDAWNFGNAPGEPNPRYSKSSYGKAESYGG